MFENIIVKTFYRGWLSLLLGLREKSHVIVDKICHFNANNFFGFAKIGKIFESLVFKWIDEILITILKHRTL